MNTGTIVGILVAIVLIGGGAWYYTTMSNPVPQGDSLGADAGMQNTDNSQNTDDAMSGDSQGSTTVNINIDASTDAAASAAVSHSASGFAPQTVTIKKGGTVTWTNTGGGDMWVASASHPTHTVYSGTTLQQHCADGDTDSFDECKNGTTYSFTFDKSGKWNYHNHSNASQFGTVVVVE